MGGKVPEITEANFATEVKEAAETVLVDFFAPWCGPCKMVSPIVEELATEYEGKLKVVKLNTDENSNVASSYGIRGVPTLILFNKGNEVDRVVGAAPKKILKEFIEKGLKSSK